MLDRFSKVIEGLDHAECVAWAPDGFIYAGGEAGQIYRCRLDGSSEVVANTSGRLLGLALDHGGRIYACDALRHEVVRVDPRDGSVESYSNGTPDRPMRLPNYPAFDTAGNLYVTDSGGRFGHDGVIFRIAPGGEATVWLEELSWFPNGCCLSAEGDALLVIETDRFAVSRVPIRADGSPGTPELVAELPLSVPDGIAVAADGSLFVATYRPDAIFRISRDGDVSVFAEDPLGWVLCGPANLAFGGPELRRLAVSSLAHRHVAVGDVDVAGVPLCYPQLSEH
jgi:gluconolactonase